MVGDTEHSTDMKEKESEPHVVEAAEGGGTATATQAHTGRHRQARRERGRKGGGNRGRGRGDTTLQGLSLHQLLGVNVAGGA